MTQPHDTIFAWVPNIAWHCLAFHACAASMGADLRRGGMHHDRFSFSMAWVEREVSE
jgi:hypothetical protein